MNKLLLKPDLRDQLRQLYEDMEAAYDVVAVSLSLSCTGCPDNCCDSYFHHHTYIEWCYLWEGIAHLPPDPRERIMARARAYELNSSRLTPEPAPVMCPLNEGGRCLLYAHRLMVCRTHGVPARLILPNGMVKEFPGCFRAQELAGAVPAGSGGVMERTSLLMRLAELEKALIGGHRLPRIKMTIARMIVGGPPRLP
jgi:hypothetical protein